MTALTVLLWVMGIHVLEIVAYLIYVLAKKNSKLEKIIINQNNYINAINILSSKMEESFSKIDERVWVQQDEDLSVLFEDFKLFKNTLREINNLDK